LSVDSGATAEDFPQRATVLGFSTDRSKIGSCRGAGRRDSGRSNSGKPRQRSEQKEEQWYSVVAGADLRLEENKCGDAGCVFDRSCRDGDFGEPAEDLIQRNPGYFSGVSDKSKSGAIPTIFPVTISGERARPKGDSGGFSEVCKSESQIRAISEEIGDGFPNQRRRSNRASVQGISEEGFLVPVEICRSEKVGAKKGRRSYRLFRRKVGAQVQWRFSVESQAISEETRREISCRRSLEQREEEDACVSRTVRFLFRKVSSEEEGHHVDCGRAWRKFSINSLGKF
ncbi:hypothetical protein U1Q18_029171, partial [Sarracenia purpurea var. burkii]